jgi:hypothetical protein
MMTIRQQGGVFGRNPTFNNVEADGTLTVSGQTTFNSNITIQNDSAPKISILDSNGGFAAATFTSENGGRDLAIFAPQDIIFDQNGLETARFLLGGGLTFNGDTAAANALDDYEEGTWTPNLARFTGGSITATYSNQVGYYTKVGNLVTLTCYVTISSISSQGSSYAYINGLPFSPIRSNDAVGIVSANTGFATVEIRTCIANSNSRLYFRTAGNGAGLASPNFLAGGEISLTLQYMTS